MNVQKVASDLESMKYRLAELEEQARSVHEFLELVLEKLQLEPPDRGELAALLAPKVAEEPEQQPVAKTYAKSIQELLDESEGKG